MLPVHVRVSAGEGGDPTPVRLRLSDDTGTFYAPLGRLADFPLAVGVDVGGHLRLAGRAFAYIDGSCEVHLPRDRPLFAEISKGPEWSPICTEVSRAPNQLSLRLGLTRWTDWRREGWYAGDMRAHEISPHAALLEGTAEGLSIVQLLARERPASHLLAFSGTQAVLSNKDCCVVVNTLNEHPQLGSVSLLHSHRVIHPLRFGAPGGDDWSVYDWAHQCQRKNGLVVWPDLHRLSEQRPQGEALAAVLLGKIDAFEIAGFPSLEPAALGLYHRLLDCGVRCALVGGSGKESNTVALGSVRTYARLADGEVMGPGAWINAVCARRTFVTTGPLLSLQVNRSGPGTVLPMEPGQVVHLRAEVASATPIDHLELLVNGDVIATKPASGNRQAALLEVDYECQGSAWIAARCHAAQVEANGSCSYAHTSPVWLDVPAMPLRASAERAGPLVEALEGTITWVDQHARCDDRQRDHLRKVLQDARVMLLDPERL